MSNPLQLQEPLKDGGIRSVNFFNGRLLASNDLSREQTARRESDWRLGLAIGDGVAFGYEVDQDKSQSTPAAPVLRIAAGLAVNRLGQALRLANDVNVALTRSFGALGGSCLFTNCVPLTGGTYVAGAGVYLLTVAPAETSEGRAATNGLNPANLRCNTDATVEAVQFRLLAVCHLFRPLDTTVTALPGLISTCPWLLPSAIAILSGPLQTSVVCACALHTMYSRPWLDGAHPGSVIFWFWLRMQTTT